MTLSQLHNGEFGRIESIRGHGPIKARLMDMGLVHGTPVEMIRRGPMSGPFEIRVRGTLVSLRPEEAEMIDVVLLRGRHGRGRRHRHGHKPHHGRGFWRRFFGHCDVE